MAPVCKVGFFTVLLVCGIFLLGSNVELGNAQSCTRECNPNAAYMICPPNDRTEPDCINCCQATNNGCQLFDSNDSPLCT
nr:proteinase inhibitor PSI-1.2-like [Ipomoea batatas]